MSEKSLRKLNSKWTIWFHKSDDNNWDFDSYIKLASFNTIEEYSIIEYIQTITYTKRIIICNEK